jgi:hypothetical protein
MKWKEFLQKAKEAGFQEEDEIDYIDFSGDETYHEAVFIRRLQNWTDAPSEYYISVS